MKKRLQKSPSIRTAKRAKRIPKRYRSLRRQIFLILRKQGFSIKDGVIQASQSTDKETIRQLHKIAVHHRREEARKRFERIESMLLQHVAEGHEVTPELMNPILVEVTPRSWEERLFRYACLHWSIPVSSGYGRRLRFLVVDQFNDKLIGVIGLGDPVFALKARDNWIGWGKEMRQQRLQAVMDAFVLGAVPPYSYLLGGKLVAMLAASNEVRSAFSRKYSKKKSLIQGRPLDGQLALITTASALGRSSIYRNLRLPEDDLFISCGFTAGSGDFHFTNGVYTKLSEFVHKECKATAKNESWGIGFRNRREVIKKGLKKLGLSPDWVYHGVARELFVIPTAKNTKSYLCGEAAELVPLSLPVQSLYEWFRERWLMKRAATNLEWSTFERDSWRLWTKTNAR